MLLQMSPSPAPVTPLLAPPGFSAQDWGHAKGAARPRKGRGMKVLAPLGVQRWALAEKRSAPPFRIAWGKFSSLRLKRAWDSSPRNSDAEKRRYGDTIVQKPSTFIA